MKTRYLFLCLCLILIGFSSPSLGQETQEVVDGDQTAATDQGLKEVKDVIVVTASRTEQRLHDAPASMTVFTAEDIERIPADDFGDYLRNVPGLNVSQMSARDIQVTGRAPTFSLANSELVLLDNRTIYLDFFGFVMWDYVPVNPREIKQIEVVRGPGSAVWGANAMNGVINLITKSPQEMQGTSLTLGGGDYSTLLGSITHAGVNGKWGYKLSGSYYEQDAYDRPTGIIPDTVGPTNPFGTPYPEFTNKGTEQPKVNFRVDYDQTDEITWSFSGGHAGTDGIMHSGIGPFDIVNGAAMDFLKADWSRRAMRATFFVNYLDGDATNLLAIGTDGLPLSFAFKSDTYNIDFSDTRVVGEKNILTYGATARQNNFDLSIAPGGEDRSEYGFFLQDEILIGDKTRLIVGARLDDIDPIGSVFSPRVSLMYAPNEDHTLRFSFNRAFRAPSMLNNYLQTAIVNIAAIPPVPPFTTTPSVLIFPSQVVGNPLLTEEQLDAYEIGYVGSVRDDVTLTVSVYRNETTDSIDFFTSGVYDAANPVPGWPLPPFLLSPPFPFADAFPSEFSYQNIGDLVDKGVEASVRYHPASQWSLFFNYSWQDESEVSGIDLVQLPNGSMRYPVSTAPEHRANLGLAFDGGRYYANGNVNYVDDAYWTDVLDARYWGPTEAYTQVNLGGGIRLAGDRVTISVTAQNILDEEVLQHVFGDIVGRKITGQVNFEF